MTRPSRIEPRIYQCRTCGYRETVSGALASASMLKCARPGCTGGSDLGARMARIVYQSPDGSEHESQWTPGMAPAGEAC